MDQQFIGEHLLPGKLGHLFVVVAFVAALFSSFSYLIAARKEELPEGNAWKKIARWGFIIQALSIAGIFISLYYIISQHLFEYNYAWKHSSRGLQVKYLLACFWEGSEGSKCFVSAEFSERSNHNTNCGSYQYQNGYIGFLHWNGFLNLTAKLRVKRIEMA